VMGMGNVVNGTNMAEVFLSGRRGGSSTSETTGDGVDSAAYGTIDRGNIGASQLGVLVGGLVRASIVARVMWSERGGWRDREG